MGRTRPGPGEPPRWLVPEMWCRRIIKRFVRWRDVRPRPGWRQSPPANQLMDVGAYWQLIDRLVASPKAYLRERCTHLELATGTKVSVATVCRAIVLVVAFERDGPHHPELGGRLRGDHACSRAAARRHGALGQVRLG